MPSTITDLDSLSGVTCSLIQDLSASENMLIYAIAGPGYDTQLRIKSDGSLLGFAADDQAQLDSLANSTEHVARLSPTIPGSDPTPTSQQALYDSVAALDPGTATVALLIAAILDGAEESGAAP